MPHNWKTYTVKELIDEKIIDKPLDGNHGGTHPKGEDFVSEGIPFVMASDINGGNIELINCKFISRNQADKLRKGLSKEGDVLLTHKASIGRTAIVPKIDYDYIMLTPQVTYYRVLNYDKLDNKYLFQYFNSSTFQNELNMRAGSGSTRAYIGITDQQMLEVILPPIKEQRAIASILSALDDKIELNLQMNKTLEEMAMALYKHWFVDFTPFKSPLEGGTGDVNSEFIDSELGKIPKGWEVKRLDEIAHKKSETFNFSGKDEVVFVNTGDVQEGRFLHSNLSPTKGLPGQAKKAISLDDILYSEIRPKNKRFAYVNFDSSNYVVSTKFMIINPKKNILSKLLYRILTMQSTVDNFNSIAEGRSGTFPQITFDAIGDIELVLPPMNIQIKFQELVGNMELQQDELYLETKTLTTLRDTLLPKLISGEVRVKDVEKTISAVL